MREEPSVVGHEHEQNVESDSGGESDKESEEGDEYPKDVNDGEDEDVGEGKDGEAEDEEESGDESDKEAKKSRSNDGGPSIQTRSMKNKDGNFYGLVDDSDENEEYVPDIVSDDEGTKPISSKKRKRKQGRIRNVKPKKAGKNPVSSKKTTKLSKRKLLGLNTRMSPKSLSETIQLLTKTQRAEVRQMRLGRLLKLRMKEIPTKLAYFVVDRFNPEKMEIDLGATQIKIDDDVVVKVLGLPNNGVVLGDTKKRSRATFVSEWRKKFPGESYVSPKEVAEMIKAERRNTGNVYFKLDFIALMVGVLMYRMKTGNLMLDYMANITDDTDLCNINWCKFMISSLKMCKKYWNQDGSSWFVGPLAFLTLVYVDGTTCGAFTQERVVPPITLWTKENLEIRVKFELKNGGFGKGKAMEFYIDEKGDISEDEGDTTTLKSCVDELEDAFEEMEHGKARATKVLKAAVAKFKGEKKVEDFIERYKIFFTYVDDINTMAHETTSINEPETELQTDGPPLDEVVANVLKAVKEPGEKPESSKIMKKKKRVKDPSMPSFDLLSSQSTIGSDADEHDREESLRALRLNAVKKNAPPQKGLKTRTAKKAVKKGTITRFTIKSGSSQQYVNLAEECRSKKTPTIYTRKEVNINEPMDNTEKKLWIYLRKLFRDKNDDDMKKPKKGVPGRNVVEATNVGTSKSNALVVKDDSRSVDTSASYLQPVFESAHGFRTQAFMMTTTLTGRWVADDVITCWAILLNYEERVITNNAPKRLYLHARTITDEMIKVTGGCRVSVLCEKLKRNIKYVLEGRDDLMDMKCFELVVVPVFEKNHYYVVAFDMRCPSVEVIDNMEGEFICPDAACAYVQKGTLAKIKLLHDALV
ncbi:hypothetical protein SSX86_031879 [Deinandra increscens subsp. villosa]|uniref:Ubiquitin-like protease family profile domain-containing protein n=1 Tax=Deinandra increscens subsp. villosa TaxID=3103831 RepID=A0AAP0GI98_9ASTR